MNGGPELAQLMAVRGIRDERVLAARAAVPLAPRLRMLYRTPGSPFSVLAAGRRAVHERFGVVLEPEVQVLGEIEWPGDWELE